MPKVIQRAESTEGPKSMAPEVHLACGCRIRNHSNGLMFQGAPGEPVAITEVNVSEPSGAAQGGERVQ